jgi:hypothetical protein
MNTSRGQHHIDETPPRRSTRSETTANTWYNNTTHPVKMRLSVSQVPRFPPSQPQRTKRRNPAPEVRRRTTITSVHRPLTDPDRLCWNLTHPQFNQPNPNDTTPTNRQDVHHSRQ